MCSRRMLEQIAELARRNNLVIFADEIYDKLILDDDEKDQQLSMAAIAPDVPVVTFGGLSKNYLAPGWRIGWGIVSGDAAAVKPYVEGIHRLLRARLCANHPEQYAIKVALDGPQDHLDRSPQQASRPPRSDRAMVQFDAASELCLAPRRVLCLPANRYYGRRRRIRQRTMPQKHVMVVHGSGFGQKPGTSHFRIVFLPDEPTLTQGLSIHRRVHRGKIQITCSQCRRERPARGKRHRSVPTSRPEISNHGSIAQITRRATHITGQFTHPAKKHFCTSAFARPSTVL